MKLSIAMLMFFGFQLSASVVFSQDSKLSVNANQERIGTVLEEIEQQTFYRFAYSSQFIDMDRKVSINVKDANINEVLMMVFDDTDTEFVIEDEFVILIPKITNAEGSISNNRSTLFLQQNGKIISGRVVDPSGDPVPGASIVIKGSTTGTITDMEGNYTLPQVPEDATLVFSFVGMKSQEVAVAGRTTIDIQFQEELMGLDEVVVIGYGTVKKSDLTGAVGTLKSDQLDEQTNNNLGTALQGKIAGVSIESAGGAPGAGMRFQIRGAGSLNNNNPLILVDDIPVSSMNNISPHDIESIQILKDASAAAIYGSRAANGVILISTKAGKEGPVKINLNVDYGIQKVANTLDLTNTEEWIRIADAATSAADIDLPSIGVNPEEPGEGIDWQDEIFRTAPVQNLFLNATGGSQHMNYSVSLGYLNQDGVIKETGYNRGTLRIKTDFKKGRFRIGETVLLSTETVDNQPGVAGQGGNVIGSAALMVPAFSIKNDEAIGGYGGAYGSVLDIFNPVAALNLKENQDSYYKALINLFTEVDLFKGMKYKFSTGLTATEAKNISKEQRYEVGSFFRNENNYIYERSAMDKYWQIENTLSFNRDFGAHSFNAVIGQTSYDYHYHQFSASKKGMPDGKWVMDSGTDEPSANGYENENTMISYLGRLIYSFDNRYIFTGTFRRDGSSRFSDANQWGNFPSISAAWNIANEAFFEDWTQVVSQLKLRGSYGKLGNQEIGDYQYMGLITSAISYGVGQPNSLWVGNIQTEYVPENLKWETTTTSNIGLDLSLYRGKLNVNFDTYKKVTTDLLLRVPIPLSVGADQDPYNNAGKVSNRGYEVMLNYNGNVNNDFKYSISGTLAHAKNEVEELSTGSQVLAGGSATHNGPSVTYTKVGHPMYSFFLIKTDGLFRSESELEAHRKDGAPIQPNAQVGDIRFIDANDDGQIDGNDRVFCGSPFPDLEYGIRLEGSWRNFDLSMFFQGTSGNKIFNGISTYTESGRFTSNYSTKLLDSYTFNPQSDIPRLDISDPNGNGVDNSDRFLEDGSYFRFRTLQVGYSLPSPLLSQLSMEKCRVYIGVDNLFTVTDYTGFNPDIGNSSISNRGIDFRQYPLNRSFHAGLQLTF
ncbi:TonB-dependent receptor [Marinilabilia sp.]|uniref:TonB-dependent receptor n=1 Tax=Marinilabilia sp. TaxID=2021252 RepID=UPI0025B7BBCC|nr:TonB-dependent receptor [Marinilabilia sp.]